MIVYLVAKLKNIGLHSDTAVWFCTVCVLSAGTGSAALEPIICLESIRIGYVSAARLYI
jgi:hypothetical protein